MDDILHIFVSSGNGNFGEKLHGSICVQCMPVYVY